MRKTLKRAYTIGVLSAAGAGATYLGIISLPGVERAAQSPTQPTAMVSHTPTPTPTYEPTRTPAPQGTPIVETPPTPMQPTRTLEEVIGKSIPPAQLQLSEWDLIAFQLLAPIKRDIESSAAWYGLDPLWLTQVGVLESNLDPLSANLVSDDFGVYQIKVPSAELALTLAAAGKYANPSLQRTKGGLFDPDTNITMAALLMRYNADTRKIEDTDKLYAFYVRGQGGLDEQGNISKDTQPIVEAMRARRSRLEAIVPAFGYSAEQIAQVKQPMVRKTLELYASGADIQAMYEGVLTMQIEDLKGKTAKPDWQVALGYSTAQVAAEVLFVAYGSPSAQLLELRELGDQIISHTSDQEIIARVRGYQDRSQAIIEGRYP